MACIGVISWASTKCKQENLVGIVLYCKVVEFDGPYWIHLLTARFNSVKIWVFRIRGGWLPWKVYSLVIDGWIEFEVLNLHPQLHDTLGSKIADLILTVLVLD